MSAAAGTKKKQAAGEKSEKETVKSIVSHNFGQVWLLFLKSRVWIRRELC